MFDNIGGKIQGLAKVVTIIGVAASLLGGLALLIGATRMRDVDGVGVLVAFGVMIGGSLLSWIGGFFVYGFGRLVQNTDILAGRMTLQQADSEDTPPPPQTPWKENPNNRKPQDSALSYEANLQRQITELDDQYKQGTIPQDEYARRRQVLIDQYFQHKPSDR